jgi:hypothetical protein
MSLDIYLNSEIQKFNGEIWERIVQQANYHFFFFSELLRNGLNNRFPVLFLHIRTHKGQQNYVVTDKIQAEGRGDWA